MKKKSKILIVVFAVALLVSVLAVNCFAFYSEDMSFNNNAPSMIEYTYYDNVFDEERYSYGCVDGYYLEEGSFDLLYSTNLSGNLWLEVADQRNYDRDESGVQYSIIQDDLDYLGDKISDFKISFEPYNVRTYAESVGEYGMASLPYRELSFDYRGIVYGSLNVETRAKYWVYDSVDSKIKEAESYCYLSTPFDYGEYSVGLFYDPYAGMSGYIDGYVDGVRYSYLETENSSVNSSLFSGIHGVVDRERFSPCLDMPMVIDQSLYVDYDSDNEFRDISLWCELDNENADGFNADVEVDFVEVDVFDWLVQAVSGILDVELFGGGFTIGSLLLIAMAIPLLIALLRLFSGG